MLRGLSFYFKQDQAKQSGGRPGHGPLSSGSAHTTQRGSSFLGDRGELANKDANLGSYNRAPADEEDRVSNSLNKEEQNHIYLGEFASSEEQWDFFTNMGEYIDEDQLDGDEVSEGSKGSADSFSAVSNVVEITSPSIIHPKNKYKVRWDLLVGVVVMFTVVTTPLRICFALPSQGAFAPGVDWFFDSIFAIDLIMCFRTAYYKEDVLVQMSGQIACHYLRTWFIIDFLSTVPFDKVLPLMFPSIDSGTARMVKMLRFFRLFRLFKLIRVFKFEAVREFIENYLSDACVAVSALLARIFFICHLFTCFWYYIGSMNLDEDSSFPACPNIYLKEPPTDPTSGLVAEGTIPGQKVYYLTPGGRSCDNGPTWVREFDVNYFSVTGKYLTSLYVIVKTIMAVGYGDIYPTNSGERGYMIIVEVAGAVVYGYILSGISRSFEATANKLDQIKLKNVQDWTDYREFDALLKRRIRQHYQYMLNHTNGYGDYHLIEVLPRSLRNDVVDKIYAKYIKGLHRAIFYTDPLNPVACDIVRDLLAYIRPQQVFPGDIICEQDDLLEDLYFIMTGCVEGLLDDASMMRFAKISVGSSKDSSKLGAMDQLSDEMETVMSGQQPGSNNGSDRFRTDLARIQFQRSSFSRSGSSLMMSRSGSNLGDIAEGRHAMPCNSSTPSSSSDVPWDMYRSLHPEPFGKNSGGCFTRAMHRQGFQNSKTYGRRVVKASRPANDHKRHRHRYRAVENVEGEHCSRPAVSALITSLSGRNKQKYADNSRKKDANDHSGPLSSNSTHEHKRRSHSSQGRTFMRHPAGGYETAVTGTLRGCHMGVAQMGMQMQVNRPQGGGGRPGGHTANHPRDHHGQQLHHERITAQHGDMPVRKSMGLEKTTSGALTGLVGASHGDGEPHASAAYSHNRSIPDIGGLDDDPTLQSNVHPVLDGIVVALYSENEYFQTRWDPRYTPENERIAYFTYIAQTTSDLIAIPMDAIIRRLRDYNVDATKNCARKAHQLCNQMDQCVASGEYQHSQEPFREIPVDNAWANETLMGKVDSEGRLKKSNPRRCLNQILYKGHATSCIWLEENGFLQNELFDELEAQNKEELCHTLSQRRRASRIMESAAHSSRGLKAFNPSRSGGLGGIEEERSQREGEDDDGTSSTSSVSSTSEDEDFVRTQPLGTSSGSQQQAAPPNNAFNVGHQPVSDMTVSSPGRGDYAEEEGITLDFGGSPHDHDQGPLMHQTKETNATTAGHNTNSKDTGGETRGASYAQQDASPFNDGAPRVEYGRSSELRNRGRVQQSRGEDEGAHIVEGSHEAGDMSQMVNKTETGSSNATTQNSLHQRERLSKGKKLLKFPGGKREKGDARVAEKKKYEQQLLKKYIIPHTMPAKIGWDIWVGLLIIYSVIVIPYRIGFEICIPKGSPEDVLDWGVDIFFFLDILANFRTTYTDAQGVAISTPSKIARNYLRGFFWIDFFSTVPIDRIVEAALAEPGGCGGAQGAKGAKFIRVVRLIRLARLLRLFKVGRIVHSLEEFGISRRAVHTAMLMVKLTFMAHLLACFFFYMYVMESLGGAPCNGGQLYCQTPPTDEETYGWWSHPATTDLGDNSNSYITSLYWSFTTMTTVGFGDIRPHTTAERVYCIIIMFLGSTAFAYIIGSIAAAGDHGIGKFAPNLRPIFDFCDKHSLSPMARLRLRRHYTFYTNKAGLFEESTFLQELPIHLRIEVLLHIHAETLRKISIFKMRHHYRDWFIAHIVSLLRPMVILEGDTIYEAGQTEPYHIYMIFNGTCEAIDGLTGELVCVYITGMLFGVEAVAGSDGEVRRDVVNGREGYPYTVRAQVAHMPSDRQTTELFVLNHELLRDLQEEQSVYYEPLKRLVATAWIIQGRAAFKEKEKRQRRITAYDNLMAENARMKQRQSFAANIINKFKGRSHERGKDASKRSVALESPVSPSLNHASPNLTARTPHVD